VRGIIGRLRQAVPLTSLALAAIPLALVAGGFLLPYLAALSAGLKDGAASALGNPRVIPLTLFTIKIAALSTLMALALGLPGAWFLGTGSRRFAAVVRALTAIPFAMPPILVVLGFVLFFGNAGWANRLLAHLTGQEAGPLRILYRPEAIILAHGFYNFPLVIRLAGDGIAQARRSYAAGAASLGASGLVTAVTVLFPLALPSLLAAVFLVFLYCFTSFALVLVLGGGPAATTLAVEIYRYARITLDYTNAGALALAETLVAVLVFAAYIFCASRGRNHIQQTGAPMETTGSSTAGKALLGVYALAILVLVIGPLLSIPAESLLTRASRSAAPSISLRWWRMLREQVLPALGRSALLAALSASIAVFAGALAAAAAKTAASKTTGPQTGAAFLSALTRFSLSLPLASSGIVLGLGWTILYGRTGARTITAVACLHAVAALPFAYASISEGLNSIPQSISAAARVFGASPIQAALTVELPLALRRLCSAWGFAAAISLGELNALLMLGMDQWETLPLLIYRAAGAYRYGTACAAGTLLLVCCFGAFILSEKLGAAHGA
jgi:thiamine transport system permease protein